MSHPKTFPDLTGERFGRWSVLGYAGRDATRKNRRMWDCVCLCGTRRDVLEEWIKNGSSKSCGCLPRGKTKHGEAPKNNKERSPEYRAWAGMIERCCNQNGKFFHRYGGRGITVCDRWRNDYKAFLEDMGRRPDEKHSLDRLDNNKGYCKENCGWRTQTEQMSNTGRNRWVEVNGVRKTINQWAQEIKLSWTAIHYRLKRGWSEHDAIMTPKIVGGRRKETMDDATAA